ncbi:exodeoxyribonuclease VII small subunit [Motiliproteus sp. MSK22-1]|uniref:exodeoxyribonuclease VII small subunit n=1 Tax=Motiliproteus sp. MSK22-1 TaxID=1897630 RepID=UPI00097833EE|nr:exodeoxyribonuclease VII small subunit [Motiliproteus sp. MSK22-1]OMH39374.1 exodeoxyribonuclease VII small subunit [Motiliproteus sp. MSK22-1]
MPRTRKEPDFEQSLAELESLVTRMEQGDMTLEQSLEAFENGVKLTRECQQRLEKAEQRVQVLIEQNGELTAKPLEAFDQE